MKQLGYKEMQNVFKEIAKISMLERDFRDLCLKDSQAAIREIIVNHDIAIPDNVIFLEEDRKGIDSRFCAYILPPFIKQSWLLSK